MRGGSNARHLAIRRIMLVIFAVVAALSIFFPELLTMLARSLGSAVAQILSSTG